MKKVLKRIADAIILLFTVCLIALIVLLALGKKNNRPVFIFNRSAVWIVSNSMEPVIPQKTYILVDKINASDVKVGDVILFYSDDPGLSGNMNTHRVVEIVGNNEEFVTRGDNNLADDKYTAKADKIVARYDRNLVFLSKAFSFFLTPLGLIVLIIFVLLLTLFAFLPDIIGRSKKKNQNKELTPEDERMLIDAEIERMRNEGDKNV